MALLLPEGGLCPPLGLADYGIGLHGYCAKSASALVAKHLSRAAKTDETGAGAQKARAPLPSSPPTHPCARLGRGGGG